MRREEFVTKLLQCIDELHIDSQNDVLTAYPIDSFMDEAAIEVLKAISPHKIPFRLDFSDTKPELLENGVVKIALPENFLQLASIQLETWQRDVNECITPQSPNYHNQFNDITRGSLAKPVVVRDGAYLYCYSLPQGTQPVIKRAEAIVVTPVSEVYPPLIADAVIWLTAYKLLSVCGENAQSEICKKHFQDKLSII